MWEATATIFQDLGVDESVRAVLLTVEEPDFSVGATKSEKCQIRTHAPQQTTKIIRSLRRRRGQKMQDCDLAELARIKRVNFPKAVCA
jgi:enoyl-CoA hydratase/carnithine racemase